MARIDTKELRRIAHAEFCETNCLTGQYSPTADLLQCADELDRLYKYEDDTRELSSEELETVLKDEGYYERKTSLGRVWVNIERNHNIMIDNGDAFCTNGFVIPLSAVTRATLERCGVIK